LSNPRGRACRPSGKGSGEEVLIKVIVRIPDDWSSILLPVFKGKGDPMECGSYTVMKLLEHAMKVIERVFERRIR